MSEAQQQKFDKQFKAAQSKYDNMAPPDDSEPEWDDFDTGFRGWKCLECGEVYMYDDLPVPEDENGPNDCECCKEEEDYVKSEHPGFIHYVDHDSFEDYCKDCEAEAAYERHCNSNDRECPDGYDGSGRW